MEAVLLILAVVVAVGLFVRARPRAARRWYRRSETARKVGAIVIGSLIAIVFLLSGDPIRSFIGVLLLMFGALYLFIEQPWRRV